MEAKIYVPDIECDSCVKLITKKLKSTQGVDSFDIKKDSLNVNYEEALVTPDNIIKTIQNAGFRAGTEPFERKTLNERVRDFKENKDKYVIELTGIKYVIYAFLLLSGIELLAYYGFLKNIPNFFANYAWWLLYLNISIVALGAAIWHFLSYKAKITCMVGMMIGMTFGMQAGMMLGAVMGATNGFFAGAMIGMIVGVTVGIITGKCCGIMGIMQGMMAGLMGGTMGPMIVLMMFSDHLLWFMPFYMIVNVMILAGFSYMMIEEVAEAEKVEKTPIDFLTFASGCLLFAFAMIIIMMYGPKSLFIL